MTPERWQQAQDLFYQALDLPQQERKAFLRHNCEDEVLREQVEALLAADAQPPSILETALASTQTLPPVDEEKRHEKRGFDTSFASLDQHIGPYRILHELGRGGMGTVYFAKRTDLNKHVALKLVRGGLASPEILQRFQRERRLLARLEHPNIARLLDAGMTKDGTPFFVMEYVEGEPLTTYCDRRKLTISERLVLFQHVCQAVHYAHQNLIIHRDLKPQNILVDANGRVKLLDFGIAKLMEDDDDVEGLTRTGMRLMTPEYAAPEQVCGEVVTTATDVYGLGVLLYELITGYRPFSLQGRSIREMERVICDQDPVRPSVAARNYADKMEEDEAEEESGWETIHAIRTRNAGRLARRLKGDLDTICLKALAKEPLRRYASAEALSEDLYRHSVGLPVRARPDTLPYRAGKFIRRHRVGVASAFLVGVLMLGSMAITLVQSERIREKAEEVAQERDKAEEMAALLEGLFAEADPYRQVSERKDTMQVQEFLARGMKRVLTDLSDQPLVQAQMLDVVGRVYRSLGLYNEAQPLLERALQTRRESHNSQHPDVAKSLTNLAVLFLNIGEFEQAQTLLEEALAINRKAWGNDHTMISVVLNHLGSVLRERGLYADSEHRHLEAIEMLRRMEGDQDPRLAMFMNDLVITLEQAGDYDAAERYARESLALHRALFEETQPQLAVALQELGLVLQRKAAYPEAEVLYREALRISEESLGQEHPQIADLLNRLGSINFWQKDLAAADSIHRKSVALKRRLYGDVHIEVAYGLNNLATVQRARQAFAEADSMHREALEIARATVGPEHAGYWILLGNLGITLQVWGDCQQAEMVLRESIAGIRRTIPKDLLRFSWQQRWLGDCLIEMGRYEEAETMLLESHNALLQVRGEDDDFTRKVTELLTALYTAWGKPDKASQWSQQLLKTEGDS